MSVNYLNGEVLAFFPLKYPVKQTMLAQKIIVGRCASMALPVTVDLPLENHAEITLNYLNTA
ncbi:hypothetical protein [Alteromonas antoniana]|uniref:hypothetical protein n=1 Tax=Alteromonas antoniana TaxID=2803813 RepID=UPI001C48F89D|nr:hypothetical protein [Alteromonas antoniana]